MSRCPRQLLIIGDAKLYVVFDEQCIKADGSGGLVEDLECNLEEANTRMLLHTHHVYYSTDNAIICTPDNHVLIIAIAISTEIPGNLFIHFGTKSNARIKSVEKVIQSLMLC